MTRNILSVLVAIWASGSLVACTGDVFEGADSGSSDEAGDDGGLAAEASSDAKVGSSLDARADGPYDACAALEGRCGLISGTNQVCTCDGGCESVTAGQCAVAPNGQECNCFPSCHKSVYPADGGGGSGSPGIDCPKHSAGLHDLFACPGGPEVMYGCIQEPADASEPGYAATTWYCCP
jgi:hypothetical protein